MSNFTNGLSRFLAALENKPAPLAAGVAYPEIPFRDRAWEHTDLPWWIMDEADPEKCLPVVRAYLKRAGCDWWNVLWTSGRKERAQLQYLHEANGDFVLDKRTGVKRELFPPWKPRPVEARNAAVPAALSDEAWLERIAITPAGKQIADGWWDFAKATVETLGREYFVYSYASVPFSLSFGKGFEQTMMDLATNPSFLHRMGERQVASQKEYFRAMGKVGVRGIWLQDFYDGQDLISRDQYQQVVLPHGQDLVAEAHRAGLIVVHHFMGNANDRADLVAKMGADALLFEEGRRGYQVNIAALAKQIARDDVVMMGNLATESALESADDRALIQEIERLAQWGQRRGRFIFATGSPPTPQTSIDRIRFALDAARNAGGKDNREP